MTFGATRSFVLLVAFTLAGACATPPDLPNGGVSCGVNGLCPDGFECAADGFCYNDGSGPDNCGNGIIEAGETCDPIELCPESCDDGNACTNDVALGAAETCNLTCLNDLITECQSGDGCCPDACDSDSDDDCSATCGNGTIDDGETCDPPGSCPTSCTDGNSCTTDALIGNPANCNVTCTFTAIRDCNSGDGCCPAGCTANSDDDCSASCGNGTIETGETCDPPASCPTSCSDGNSCTIDNRVGSANNCNVSCTFTPIVQCKNGDGCCPSGCTNNNDNDCSASCGNGTIESGETCDPPGSCPATCDDNNDCTIDNRTGQPSQCNVVCSSSTIVSCEDDDGCCPSGCTANDDSDCSVTCGNGTVEEGETCEPGSTQFPCPTATDCATGDPCRPGFLTGSAEQCNARCAVSEIKECRDKDECCPLPCIGRDSDCAASECGDGFCAPEEVDECEEDCRPECGDKICVPAELPGGKFECPDDCPEPECGNRECEPGELPDQPFECPDDCPKPDCGNRECEPGEGPGGPFECPEDCGTTVPPSGFAVWSNDAWICLPGDVKR